MNDRAILEELFLFENLTELPNLTALPPAVSFSRGASIYAPHDYPKALGVVLRGRAEAVSMQRSSAVLSVFAKGAVFGAAALFGGDGYVSQIRATTDCRVQFLPEQLLREWFVTYPQISLNYMAFLTDRVRFLNGKIAVFTCEDAAEKLYSWLQRNNDENTKLSMTKLAATLNIGRTSLYRAMDELEAKHLIVREDGKVRVI